METRQTFLNEARLLSTITSPLIVRVFSAFLENGTAYIIMEHLEGLDLKELIEKSKNDRNQKQFDEVFIPIVKGILELHEVGIIHRDFKPDNVVFRVGDKDPVLIDFGNALQDLVEVTRFVLTYSYAPIEQFSDNLDDIGPWTDIYSVAATMYQYVCGTLFTKAPQRILKDAEQSLVDIAPPGIFRPSLLKSIMWGSSILPKDRPQSINEWYESLFPSSLKTQSFEKHDSMKTNIFISYRRIDSVHFSGRIFDRLQQIYGSDRIFFDLNSIPFAVNFEEHIQEILSETAVVLAVIGNKWPAKSWKRHWWQTNPKKNVDYVQIEIEQAIANGIPIIPILINDTQMPEVKILPETMRAVSKLNAVNISAGRQFDANLQSLLSVLDRIGVRR